MTITLMNEIFTFHPFRIMKLRSDFYQSQNQTAAQRDLFRQDFKSVSKSDIKFAFFRCRV